MIPIRNPLSLFTKERKGMLSDKQSTMYRILILSMTIVIGFMTPVDTISQVVDKNMGEVPVPASSEVAIIQNAFDPKHVLQPQYSDISKDDQNEMLALLSVLEEETEVATKTKMNSDYVPGIVTVLHGDQLEALGIRTVADALTMVPGIQVSYIETGEPTLKVRGIHFPFNAGNVKVLLNSIALSRESSGINSSTLLIPVEQVDRIEIIRGPSSSIYGDFAMAGLVNIITSNTGGRLFGYAGDNESIGGGAIYSYRDEERSMGVDLNISAVDDGENATSLGRNPDGEKILGVCNFEYKGFSLTAEGVTRDLKYTPRPPLGIAPGTTPLLNPEKSSKQEESWVVEGRQSFERGKNFTGEAHLSFLRNDMSSDTPIQGFNGDRVEAGLDLHWNPLDINHLFVGFSYVDSDIVDAYQSVPGEPISTDISGVNRRISSMSIQDQMDLFERFSLTLGARFDDYSDVGTILTPRIACVFQLAEGHLIKSQYSEGFRAPTFWEEYSNSSSENLLEKNGSLDFEVLNTAELAYVYRKPTTVGRVTLYHSKTDDMIYNRPGPDGVVFGNFSEFESKGVEVEWEQQFGEKFRWLANISYVDAWDGRSGESANNHALGVADWLANIAFFLKPLPKFLVTGRLLHVGDTHAPDGWADGYDSLDLTVSRMDLFAEGVTLRVGVKNIFDDKIVYQTVRGRNLFEGEFQGRNLWLQASYEF